MEPTKKSIKKNKKNVRRINSLLNDLKEEPNEDNIYKIIKTLFNSRGLKLSKEYIDLACSLFGDKLIEVNNTIRPECESSEYDDEEDGYDIIFVKPDDNQKIEIFNVANHAAISVSRYEEISKWALKWQEIRFLVEKGQPPVLEIINSSTNTLKDGYIFINMNQSIEDIINDIKSATNNTFLPNGSIIEHYMTNNKKKKKIKKNT